MVVDGDNVSCIVEHPETHDVSRVSSILRLRNPRVVYIDEGKKKWELNESMIEMTAQSSLDVAPPQPTGMVSVKSALKIKKKVE